MPSSKHIVAHEYEYLTRLDSKRHGCHDLTNSQFAALREFVLANRGEDEDSPLELMRLCSPVGIGEAFQLRNYVGVIELDDGFQIEVLPKIDIAEGCGANEREVFMRMLAALGPEFSFKAMGSSHVASAETPLFEVFVGMFVAEASRLVRGGLRSAYVEVHDDLPFVKGKLDVSRMLRRGDVHKERLPVAYDEFLLDRAENRLIKTTLELLRRKTRSDENSRAINRLLPAFESVGVSHNVDADLARCVTDRATRRYGMLLAWCRVFLRGESFSMFRGKNVATALLFPMERVFEEYMGQELRLAAIRSRALRRVDLQVRTKWLFDRSRVSLRPDIVCERHDGSLVVLDTKWKRVSGPRDLSVADMHQMYAYGRRYRSEGEEVQRVILLYPWHKGERGAVSLKPGLLESGRHTSEDGVQVDMFFVDLGNMGDSVRDLLGEIG